MKLKLDIKTVSTSIIIVLLICEICTTSAKPAQDKHKNRQLHKSHSTVKKHRHRRQAADILFMGYQAKGGLGTTRPSDFFRRIGKKRADRPALAGLPKTYLEPDIHAVAVDRNGFLLGNEEYPDRW